MLKFEMRDIGVDALVKAVTALQNNPLGSAMFALLVAMIVKGGCVGIYLWKH